MYLLYVVLATEFYPTYNKCALPGLDIMSHKPMLPHHMVPGSSLVLKCSYQQDSTIKILKLLYFHGSTSVQVLVLKRSELYQVLEQELLHSTCASSICTSTYLYLYSVPRTPYGRGRRENHSEHELVVARSGAMPRSTRGPAGLIHPVFANLGISSPPR